MLPLEAICICSHSWQDHRRNKRWDYPCWAPDCSCGSFVEDTWAEEQWEEEEKGD